MDGTFENRDFEVDFDLGLSSADTDIVSTFAEVELDIADWLLPRVVGCDLHRPLDKGDENLTPSGICGDGGNRLLQTATAEKS